MVFFPSYFQSLLPQVPGVSRLANRRLRGPFKMALHLNEGRAFCEHFLHHLAISSSSLRVFERILEAKMVQIFLGLERNKEYYLQYSGCAREAGHVK